MKILFMGRKQYAADMLKWTMSQGYEVVAVVTDDHVVHSPTAQMGRALNIPIVSEKQAGEMISSDKNAVDIVISYLYWKKIKEPLISTPRFGCINFHPAILPDWKGTAGYNIAILNKLTEWGASAHRVDHDIDTGPIIKVFRFSIDYRLETARSLEKKTQEIQCALYKSVLTEIRESGGLYGPFMPNTGGRCILKKEMLDLMRVRPGDDVSLKARAFWFPPYHGAYIEIDGEKYTLVDSFILEQLAIELSQARG